jgi:prefoldin subunit 5
MDSEPKINPNLANHESLTTMPGIGEALAERIIAGRPYRAPEDLLRITGIGPSLLERVQHRLVFNEDGLQAARPGLAPAVEKTAAPQSGAAARAALGTSQPDFITRERAMWLVLVGGAVSAVVAVILSLAILAGINGTLSVERQDSIRQLRIQADVMSTQLDAISANLDSIQSRLRAVEGLSGRMTLIEDEAQALRGEMDSALTELGRVEDTVAALSDQIGSIKESVNQFDQFLQGIRSLLGQIFPGPVPEVTP